MTELLATLGGIASVVVQAITYAVIVLVAVCIAGMLALIGLILHLAASFARDDAEAPYPRKRANRKH